MSRQWPLERGVVGHHGHVPSEVRPVEEAFARSFGGDGGHRHPVGPGVEPIEHVSQQRSSVQFGQRLVSLAEPAALPAGEDDGLDRIAVDHTHRSGRSHMSLPTWASIPQGSACRCSP